MRDRAFRTASCSGARYPEELRRRRRTPEQAEVLCHENVVVRIENAADVLGAGARLDRPDGVALVKLLQVELLDRAGAPEAKRVHGEAAEAWDRRVVRRREDVPRIDPLVGSADRAGSRRFAPDLRTARGSDRPVVRSPMGFHSGATRLKLRPGRRRRYAGGKSRSRSAIRSRKTGMRAGSEREMGEGASSETSTLRQRDRG